MVKLLISIVEPPIIYTESKTNRSGIPLNYVRELTNAKNITEILCQKHVF